MICTSCPIIEICKTYEFITKQLHAEITITACKYNNSINFQNQLSPTYNNSAVHTKEDTRTNNPNYMGQAKPDLRDLEKAIKNEPEKPEPQKVNCITCGGLTYDDDINICYKCGKPVCSNCGTSADGHMYCESCWEKEGEENT